MSSFRLKTFYVVFTALFFLLRCGGSKTEKFPLEKRYWTPEDYDNVIREIEFQTPKSEKYPNLADPETSPIFKKLLDRENVSVVAEDNALGLRHRSDFTGKMFDEYRDLLNLYQVMDREDKYVYDRELLEILRWGLYLEIHYFKLGNDKIRQEADSEAQVKGIISNNEQTIISNFNIYLDFVNQENSFSEESLGSYADGMDESFFRLIEVFPEADFRSMLSKAENMEKKVKDSSVKRALAALIAKLKAKVETVPTP